MLDSERDLIETWLRSMFSNPTASLEQRKLADAVDLLLARHDMSEFSIDARDRRAAAKRASTAARLQKARRSRTGRDRARVGARRALVASMKRRRPAASVPDIQEALAADGIFVSLWTVYDDLKAIRRRVGATCSEPKTKRQTCDK